MLKLIKGNELMVEEHSSIKNALQREFKYHLPDKEKLDKILFFIFKKDKDILAFGGLLEVYPIVLDNKKYKAYGFVEIVANVKGEGHGKEVVTGMKKFLEGNDLAGIGFCHPKNKGFYEKCGLKFLETSTQRFVYMKDNERITNKDGQIVFYVDSSERLFKKIMKKKDMDVLLPTDGLW